MDTKYRIPYHCASVLFWIHHVLGAIVPPPTNVTLHCHNMQNILSWGYEESVDGLRFKVFVGSESGTLTEPVELWVNSPNMSIDLSKYSNPDDAYGVQVSAVKGNAESESMPKDGLSYSYFKDSPANVKCSLDLPSVDVTTLEENHLHFSFTHPGVLYTISTTSQRPRMKRSPESQGPLPLFNYHVEVLSQVQESPKYSCSEEKCQGKLHVHGSEKSYCLNISGEMEKMSVRATKKYCSEPLKAAGINPVAYIVPIVLVLVGAVIGSMVFVKRTRPQRQTQAPAVLIFPRGNNQQNPAEHGISDYVLPEVEPSSPVPLIPSDQNTSSDSYIFRDEVRLRLGVPDNENENEPEDGYTQGNCLDEDDEQEEEEQAPSAYEQRNMP